MKVTVADIRYCREERYGLLGLVAGAVPTPEQEEIAKEAVEQFIHGPVFVAPPFVPVAEREEVWPVN